VGEEDKSAPACRGAAWGVGRTTWRRHGGQGAGGRELGRRVTGTGAGEGLPSWWGQGRNGGRRVGRGSQDRELQCAGPQAGADRQARLLELQMAQVAVPQGSHSRRAAGLRCRCCLPAGSDARHVCQRFCTSSQGIGSGQGHLHAQAPSRRGKDEQGPVPASFQRHRILKSPLHSDFMQ
jgi:hypothetical protein